MSRIGKLPISIPSGVSINVSDDNVISVKGKLGELQQQIDPAIGIKVDGENIELERTSEIKEVKAKHGLYRSLVNNMVQGVTEGYSITLELIGVGYRAQVQNNVLDLSLGFSHHIYLQLPPEIQCETTAERGKSPTITLKSIDKQLVGQVAAKIRSLRKPEPYKGKGVRYKGEVVRKKAGKAAEK